MKKRVLFVHGGGEGAYEEDKKLAENLRDVLGAAFSERRHRHRVRSVG
jgi:hypothetical protein